MDERTDHRWANRYSTLGCSEAVAPGSKLESKNGDEKISIVSTVGQYTCTCYVIVTSER